MYNEIFETAKKLHIEHVVHFMGYVSEVDRNKLYSHALCFVLPSLYEGFGIPLLEAFAASCPVLSSNSSSLPEVGGGAPLYFKPDSVQELLDKLRLVDKDFKLTYSMVERGLAQAQKFSWETCAEDTLELLLKWVIRYTKFSQIIYMLHPLPLKGYPLVQERGGVGCEPNCGDSV